MRLNMIIFAISYKLFERNFTLFLMAFRRKKALQDSHESPLRLNPTINYFQFNQKSEMNQRNKQII